MDNTIIDIDEDLDENINLSYDLIDDIMSLGYKFIKVIRRSLFGSVVLAQCIHTNKYIAIKISINYAHKQNDKKNEDVKAEAKILKYISKCAYSYGKEFIVSMIQKKKLNNVFFLVLEYYDEDLFSFILRNKGHISHNIARKIFTQIVYGVKYMHSIGLCHLDLSLENIMLDNNYNVKIIDFGLARRSKSFEFSGVYGGIGKVLYMSPELLCGKKFNGIKCDIWSMGVILFALITSRSPFNKPNTTDEAFNLIYNGDLHQYVYRLNNNDINNLCSDSIKLIENMLCKSSMRISIENILCHKWMIKKEPIEEEPIKEEPVKEEPIKDKKYKEKPIKEKKKINCVIL